MGVRFDSHDFYLSFCLFVWVRRQRPADNLFVIRFPLPSSRYEPVF
jgi:hypothetical protein